MTIPDEYYDMPVKAPKDKSKWVKGPVHEAVPKLKAMRGARSGTGSPQQRRDRMSVLEQQVAELRRELDELRKGIAAAVQAAHEPAAAGE